MNYFHFTRKRLLIALAAVGLLALVAILAIGNRGGPSPAATPDVIGSPTPEVSPSIAPDTLVPEKVDPGVLEQDPYDRNPVLDDLPKQTYYWRLDVKSSRDGKYTLRATVFISEGQDPKKEIAKQRPYVLSFIRETGQEDGSYVLEFRTAVRPSESTA